MQIGFLGLGTMGLPMAANLLKAGYQVQVWNRSKDPVTKLVALGALAADSPAAAASGSDVLISMLPDDTVTRTVLIDGQALAALKTGAIHVNMATVSVAFAREMAEHHQAAGVAYIAAPVLGRVNLAEAGKLNILAAGNAAILDRMQPLFDCMGQKTWRFGEHPEQANVVKLAANFMIASAIDTLGEASALATSHGVSGEAFVEMVTSTMFATPVYQGYGNALAQRRFEPAGFKLALGYKDVRLALEAAEATHVPMPFASILKDNHLDSLAHGEGHLDWAALGLVAARRAGQN